MTTEPKTAGMVGVQRASAAVIGEVLSGKNLDRVLESVLVGQRDLSGNERSAVHSISFDVLRHYGLLAAQLDTLLTQPMNDIAVRHLLLVALAQLQFSKAAAHAIVDHAVNTCEAMGFPRAKALVNAVLRNFLRAPEKFKRERFKADIARYDFPRWWIDRVTGEHPAGWEGALLAAREHPPMWLRVNARRSNVENYLKRLAEKGMSAQHAGGAAILLEKPVPVYELPGFTEGLVSIQDLGAQLAAVLLAPAAGMRVLDACAAPGGKTSHLLELADIDLTAVDSDKRRLKRVSENLSRLGHAAKLVLADAGDESWREGPFDRILLDVPCSGAGVVRRHPDIKWIRRETDLASFARQQTRLLAALWQQLGNGGRLLYATCSIFHAENGEIIEQFNRKTQNVRQIPISEALAMLATPSGVLASEFTGGQLLPDHAHDGFFYALLEKTG